MTTTRETSGDVPQSPSDPRRVRRRAAAWVLGATTAVAVISGAVLFSWMVNETHFERPDPDFDALVGEISGLSGVSDVQSERWVEAPTFVGPTSWLDLTVTDAGLPAVMQTLCGTVYTDPVSVGVRVVTPAGTALVVGNDLDDPVFSSGTCPDFGVDAGALVREVDRLAPGVDLYASLRQENELALSAFEAAPTAGYAEMLPLVTQSEAIRAAAGLDHSGTVILESPSLSVPVTAADGDAYAALLATLARDHLVRSFAVVPDAEAPVDGIQIIAPPRRHDEVARIVAASGIPAAALPVRFLPQ